MSSMISTVHEIIQIPHYKHRHNLALWKNRITYWVIYMRKEVMTVFYMPYLMEGYYIFLQRLKDGIRWSRARVGHYSICEAEAPSLNKLFNFPAQL